MRSCKFWYSDILEQMRIYIEFRIDIYKPIKSSFCI